MTANLSRLKRVGDLIRDELSVVCTSHLRDPRLRFMTITEVRVTPDFSKADVYVVGSLASDAESDEHLILALNKASGFLRYKLASKRLMRSTPKLQFHYDTIPQNVQRISEALQR